MADMIASPAVRAYAGQKGVDLQQVADAAGRTTIAREDVRRARRVLALALHRVGLRTSHAGDPRAAVATHAPIPTVA